MNLGLNATYKAGGGQIEQLRYFLKYFSTIDPQINVTIYITKYNLNLLDDLEIEDNVKIIISRLANFSTLVRVIWEQTLLPLLLKFHKIDVLFCPGNISPILTSTKTVQWIGTIGPFWNEMYELEIPINKLQFKLNKIFMSKTAEKADAVIFESKYTRDFFINLFNIKIEKSHVIHFGKDTYYFPKIERDLRVMRNLKTPFILCVSHYYPYKNIERMLEAYAEVTKQTKKEIPLVIAGGVSGGKSFKNYYESIIRKIDLLGLNKNVIPLGLVDKRGLRTLYSSCSFTIFPSPCENFAYTLVEAMLCGTAITCSNTTAMPETCKDAALYFNPYDILDMTNKIRSLIDDENLVKIYKEKSLERVKNISDKLIIYINSRIVPKFRIS